MAAIEINVYVVLQAVFTTPHCPTAGGLVPLEFFTTYTHRCLFLSV